VPDAGRPGGERYEPVTHEEMAAAWHDGKAGGQYLDYGVEDRQKTYQGPTLWMPSRAVLTAAPPDDPAMVNFQRHFPSLRVVPVDAGHFFCEEDPDAVAATVLPFLVET
jgi:pimeloyl-ACP methyl ester carboxylesterase